MLLLTILLLLKATRRRFATFLAKMCQPKRDRFFLTRSVGLPCRPKTCHVTAKARAVLHRCLTFELLFALNGLVETAFGINSGVIELYVSRLQDNRSTARATSWVPRRTSRPRGRPKTRWKDDLERHLGHT